MASSYGKQKISTYMENNVHVVKKKKKERKRYKCITLSSYWCKRSKTNKLIACQQTLNK